MFKVGSKYVLDFLKTIAKTKIFYVCTDLSRHMVQNPSEALELLSTGMMRRTSATTHANGHSSRSHAVFSVHCTMARVKEGLPCETAAKLHLVDLAGR